MTIENIIKEISNFINTEINKGNPIEITNETNLIEVGIDSIALMMLIVFLEEKYDFEAGEDALTSKKFNKIEDVVKYIYMKLST